MKWFKHFTDAHDSNDLTKIRMKYGAEGYAIYWYCLELIAGDLIDENITFELRHDAEVIGFNLKIDTARVEEIMQYMIRLGLFENMDNKITCLKLAKYLDKKTTRNNEIHKIIDANYLSGTVPDNPGSSPVVRDCPRSPGLELEEKEKRKEKKDQDHKILPASQEESTALPLDDPRRPPEEVFENQPQKPPPCPHEKIIEAYHEVLPELRTVREWNSSRRKYLNTRWRENPERQTVEWWRKYFMYVKTCPFLVGKKNHFQADLEWLVRPTNFVKVIEGKYEETT